MKPPFRFLTIAALLAGAVCASVARVRPAAERTQAFDNDPGWEGINNRATRPRTVRQDFGFSTTSHAANAPGEVGGFITPAGEPAYYAKPISSASFNDALSASGTLNCTSRKFHALIGFFNSHSINEWRTPNSIALRVQGRGDHFYAYLEYCTRRWRAGGDSPQGFTYRDPSTGKQRMHEFALNTKLKWSLAYDPNGNGGGGRITATIGDATAICDLDKSHKSDGAVFDRFGLLNIVKSVDDGGEVWLGNLKIQGKTQGLDRDPLWDGFHNRRTYPTLQVRPHGDFGFSPTQFAGGRTKGEMGGLVFRGDGRYKDKMGCYGDLLEDLNLDRPIRASGRVALRRGVSDSTTLIGFYGSRESMRIYDAQDAGTPPCFLGIAVEGPSSEGFLVYPVYHFTDGHRGEGRNADSPHILPNGVSHEWKFEYDPADGNGNASITVTFDGQSTRMMLRPGDKSPVTRFNRFGIITTRIDGNGQLIYFDDLTYSFRHN